MPKGHETKEKSIEIAGNGFVMCSVYAIVGHPGTPFILVKKNLLCWFSSEMLQPVITSVMIKLLRNYLSCKYQTNVDCYIRLATMQFRLYIIIIAYFCKN